MKRKRSSCEVGDFIPPSADCAVNCTLVTGLDLKMARSFTTRPLVSSHNLYREQYLLNANPEHKPQANPFHHHISKPSPHPTQST